MTTNSSSVVPAFATILLYKVVVKNRERLYDLGPGWFQTPKGFGQNMKETSHEPEPYSFIAASTGRTAQLENDMSTDSVALVSPQPKSRRAWYRQLWVQVLIAMAIGVVVGHFYPAVGQRMQPLGDGFIKLIRMLIAPIIFCTVVHGIAKMSDLARVGRVALKAIIYFEVLTTVALAIAMVVVNLWQPGAGMHINTAALD